MTTTDEAIIERIRKLKKERNAVILAHNYQAAEVQDISDFVGDTLEICREAEKSEAAVIVVCGVDFMAETVSLFCPDKTVLIPEPNAVCPLGEMITAERLEQFRKENPGSAVICYLKSPAEVKAASDICCTAANAALIAGKLTSADEERPALFVPDQYLGDYICVEADLDMDLWPGYCPSLFKIEAEDITRLKVEYPRAKVVVHPQCTPQVRSVADAVLSAGGILDFARDTEAGEVIVGAETGILYRLARENPGKKFIPASERAVCGKMKLITVETVLWSLENLTHEVKVPEEIGVKAKKAIDRMLSIDSE